MAQVMFSDGLIYLSLKDIIDLEEEKNRLNKNLIKINSEISKIQLKLEDKKFLDNAPEEIVNEQKKRKKITNYQKTKSKKSFMVWNKYEN